MAIRSLFFFFLLPLVLHTFLHLRTLHPCAVALLQSSDVAARPPTMIPAWLADQHISDKNHQSYKMLLLF